MCVLLVLCVEMITPARSAQNANAFTASLPSLPALHLRSSFLRFASGSVSVTQNSGAAFPLSRCIAATALRSVAAKQPSHAPAPHKSPPHGKAVFVGRLRQKNAPDQNKARAAFEIEAAARAFVLPFGLSVCHVFCNSRALLICRLLCPASAVSLHFVSFH